MKRLRVVSRIFRHYPQKEPPRDSETLTYALQERRSTAELRGHVLLLVTTVLHFSLLSTSFTPTEYLHSKLLDATCISWFAS